MGTGAIICITLTRLLTAMSACNDLVLCINNNIWFLPFAYSTYKFKHYSHHLDFYTEIKD